MKKKELILLTVLIFVLVSNIYSQIDKIPGWYLNPPQDDENIYALGDGSSLGLALMFALGNLSEKLDAEKHQVLSNLIEETLPDTSFKDVVFNKDVSKVITTQQFNNVMIEQMTTSNIENFQIAAKLNYVKSDKSLKITGFIKESGEADSDDLQLHSFSEEATGCDINDVIIDLEEIGITLKKACDDDNFYVMIKYPIAR